MQWNLIAHVGKDDAYTPELAATEPRLHIDMKKKPGPNSLGPDPIAQIAATTGRVPPDAASDLMTVCAAAYAADLSIPRIYASNRWERQVCLHVPVVDVALWDAVSHDVCALLRFLTGDSWELRLRPVEQVTSVPVSDTAVSGINTTCLFSGGLDSLVGAIDLLSQGDPIALVGHYGAGNTKPVQQRVLDHLRRDYDSLISPLTFYVQPPKTHHVDEDQSQTDSEPSMRSRSILFLALGVAVATAMGESTRLVIAENGPISLNVPLTSARMGSLSTRTTHPHVISSFTTILRRLGISTPITLPYRFQTKGEMLLNCEDRDLLTRTAPATVSCSHPDVGRYRKAKPGGHCGYCVPCLIRRASLRTGELPEDEYLVDVLSAPPSIESQCSRDLNAFRIALHRIRSATPSQLAASVLGAGPLPRGDIEAYVDVYRRGMDEVRELLTVDEV